MIDWTAIATIAAPVLALFLGVWVNRRFESRPVLVSYYGHVASFQHTPGPGQQAVYINTHSVVLRNAGRRPATNVRLHHVFLPSFNIWPQLVHSVQTLPDGSQDILIPTLVPGEVVAISYLYFHPVTFAGVNAGIKCDQGFAEEIPVLLQRQYPRWFNLTVLGLMLVGLVSLIYVLYVGVSRVLR
jgi:hypothetical protein